MEHGPPNMTVAPTLEYPEYYFENLMENSENESSSGSLDFDDWMQIPSLVIAPLGLLGNGAVLWLLGFRIQRTPFSVYILNLAAADTLFLCSASLLNIDAFLGRIFHYLTRQILSSLKFIFYVAGLNLLVAISIERCLSVLFPLWYRCHRPKHTSATVCAVLWALAGVLGAIGFSHCSKICHIIYTVYFFLLVHVLGASSLTLVLMVQCSSQRRQPPRLYRLVQLTEFVFLFCGVPWGIGIVMRFFSGEDIMLYWLSDLLACVNSSVNPLIYFFVGRLGHKQREPLRAVLQRALREEQEEGGGTTNTPHTRSQEITL